MRYGATQGTIMKRKLLTAAEFDEIRPQLELVEKNVAAVRSVLVDGVLQKDVASRLNVSEKTISALVQRVRAVHERHEKSKVPEGWRPVQVVLPEPVADAVEQMAHSVREKAGNK
jgi:transposase